MKALLILSLFLTVTVQAKDFDNHAAQPTIPTTSYYTLREPDHSFTSTGTFQQPIAIISSSIQAVATTTISLLDWVLRKNMPLPTEAYRRVHHFGRWINDPTDDTCMNTRAKVLVRDSNGDVVFKNDRNCMVTAGQWSDPYAGLELTSSREIQIDHVVPLKHAYVAGAWNWDFNTRCLYANFMGSNYHLMSVSGRENMSKGDRSPDKYMPPSPTFRCEYLNAWLRIKATWKLAISLPEARAIQNLIQENNCSRSSMVITTDEVRTLRQSITHDINYCTLSKRR